MAIESINGGSGNGMLGLFAPGESVKRQGALAMLQEGPLARPQGPAEKDGLAALLEGPLARSQGPAGKGGLAALQEGPLARPQAPAGKGGLAALLEGPPARPPAPEEKPRPGPDRMRELIRAGADPSSPGSRIDVLA